MKQKKAWFLATFSKCLGLSLPCVHLAAGFVTFSQMLDPFSTLEGILGALVAGLIMAGPGLPIAYFSCLLSECGDHIHWYAVTYGVYLHLLVILIISGDFFRRLKGGGQWTVSGFKKYWVWPDTKRGRIYWWLLIGLSFFQGSHWVTSGEFFYVWHYSSAFWEFVNQLQINEELPGRKLLAEWMAKYLILYPIALLVLWPLAFLNGLLIAVGPSAILLSFVYFGLSTLSNEAKIKGDHD